MATHPRQDSSKAKTDGRIRRRWFFFFGSHCYQTCQFWKPQKDRRPSPRVPLQDSIAEKQLFPDPDTRGLPFVSFRLLSRASPPPVGPSGLLLLPISTLQSHTAPVLHSAPTEELRTRAQSREAFLRCIKLSSAVSVGVRRIFSESTASIDDVIGLDYVDLCSVSIVTLAMREATSVQRFRMIMLCNLTNVCVCPLD